MRKQPGGSAYNKAMLDAEDGQKNVGAKKCWGKKMLGDDEREPLMNAHGSLIERSRARSINNLLHRS